MIRLEFLLVVIAACSSRTRTGTCPVEPIKRAHCDAPIGLAEMRARANVLVGNRVTLTAPLGETYPWTDCWPPIGAMLALVEPAPAPRKTVTMTEWKCPQREDRDRADCPIPPDGRSVVVRGRLERVLHSETNFVLHDTELCESHER
ncbi:MAG: hypothetical protein ACKV2T_17710 [Kofleriaceae bacterium]